MWSVLMEQGRRGATLARACAALLMLSACSAAPAAIEDRGSGSLRPPPSLAGFSDAIHHWQNRHGTGYARYSPDRVRDIADNILLLQRDHGGWAVNQDPTRVLSAEDRAAILAEKSREAGSFDNRNIYTQVEYLMDAYEQLSDDRYRDAALRGLDYLLVNQFPSCGGWPHSLPRSEGYTGMLTVADEVFSGPLSLLQHISERRYPFESLNADVQARVARALESGQSCLLRLQVRQGGKLTGWAGQYDPETLAPVQGRAFELPSIAAQESIYILYYLMSVKSPSPDIVAAIDGGVAWLQAVAIHGQRLEQYKLPEPVEFPYHTASYDRRLVADPNAPLLWARFYDLENNSIVLANRDSIRVDRYEDVSQERRTGYHWFGTWGQALIEADHAAWRCSVVEQRRDCPPYADRQARID